MTNYHVQIIQNDTINSAFIRANAALIDKHLNLFDQLTADNLKNDLLEKLWSDLFRAKLITNAQSTSWSTISFENHYDMMVFLLKWSS